MMSAQFEVGFNAVCDGSRPTKIVEITSVTGKVWMDRNLGANRAAVIATDYEAYGCLYQWGRGNDGHSNIRWYGNNRGIPINGTTDVLSSGDNPGHSDFIVNEYFYDWRSPSNSDLWQGVNGNNNPCPSGYRVPTLAELNTEFNAYDTTNGILSYNVLKFVLAGGRDSRNASIVGSGEYGFLWSSTLSSGLGSSCVFNNLGYIITTASQANGFSVRCIKN